MDTRKSSFNYQNLRIKVSTILVLFLSTSLLTPFNTFAAPRIVWHISALTIGAISFGAAQTQKQNYNNLVSEDKELDQEYQNATTTQELRRIEEEHDDNLEQMEQYKANMLLFYRIAAAALLWELYLLLSDPGGQGTASLAEENGNEFIPRVEISPGLQSQGTTLRMSWKF